MDVFGLDSTQIKTPTIFYPPFYILTMKNNW